MSLYRLSDTQCVNLMLRATLLALLAVFAAGCGTDHDQPGQVAEQSPLAVPAPPVPASKSTAAVASTSADAMYSDAPDCNALVTRLADEMVPCLERVNPEYSKRLKAIIDTFGKNPRMLLDPVHRDEVLRRTEEDCRSYWRSITYQIDSKSPEGQCRFKIPN